jgi:hypothetical protein
VHSVHAVCTDLPPDGGCASQQQIQDCPNVFIVDKVMDGPEGIPAQWNFKNCCKRRAPDPMAKGRKSGKGVSAELEDEAEDRLYEGTWASDLVEQERTIGLC